MTGGGGAAGAIGGELTVVVVADNCVPGSKRTGATGLAGVAAGRAAGAGDGCGSILGATLVPPRLPNIFHLTRSVTSSYRAASRSRAKGNRASALSRRRGR